MDNQSRLALVRVGNPFPDDTTPDVKYHLSDHLGSSNVVVDETGSWVNREEYTPYGETSFGSFARKRYRFTGKERDEESGLNYHGARYYAHGLGRWTSSDPAGMIDGINLYVYAHNNSSSQIDPGGTQTCNPDVASCEPPRENPGSANQSSSDIKKIDEFEQINEGNAQSIKAIKQSLGAGGYGVVRAAPEGYTKVVPDTFSLSRKLIEYQKAVLNGEIARNAGSGNSTQTRRNSPEQVAARQEFARRIPTLTEEAPGGEGWDIDHIIELQDDRTGRKGNSWRDYQWQDGFLNRSEGSQNWNRYNRNYPQGERAGGVARASDAVKWYNTEGYRTAVRGTGQFMELYAAMESIENISLAMQLDISQGTRGEHTAKQVMTEAGGWGGAVLVGGETAIWGAYCGPYAPICMPALGLVGGGIGFFAGSSAVKTVIGN